MRFTNSAMHSGPSSIDFDDRRPVADWLGVWRFDDDLQNAVTGVEVSGTNIQYMDSCP